MGHRPHRPSPDLRPLLERRADPFAGLSSEARHELLAAAAQHGLLALLPPRLPEDDAPLRARFQRLATAARLSDARAREVLDEVLAALSGAGIVPVALKGPVLAERLYPVPALRPSTDLDLLVPEDGLDRAAAALTALGFERADPLVDAYQRRLLHHLHLGRAPGPDVELHFRPQSLFGSRLPTEAFLARSQPHLTDRGRVVRVLAPEDELLTLAVHAAGHLFERAGWVLDLVLLLDRNPGLDWAAVETRTAAYRCRRAVAYALGAVRDLGAPVPAGLTALDGPRRVLAARLSAAGRSRKGRVLGAIHLAFQAVLRDRPWGVAPQLLHEAGWVVRRRVVRLGRRLRSHRGRSGARTRASPPGGSGR